jgi:hypothetical protein
MIISLLFFFFFVFYTESLQDMDFDLCVSHCRYIPYARDLDALERNEMKAVQGHRHKPKKTTNLLHINF